VLLGKVLFSSAYILEDGRKGAYLQVSLGERDLGSKDELVA
jgi:hypothetical protein